MQTCLVCHGADGSGAMPGVTDLAENNRLSTLDDVAVAQIISQGVQQPGASVVMPPRGGNPDLSDEQLLAAVQYLRKLLHEQMQSEGGQNNGKAMD